VIKEKNIGICKLCGKNTELNLEHIPPRSAFNKNSNFFFMNIMELYTKPIDYFFNCPQPKTKIEQGGIRIPAFCVKCNGFLGSKYVPTYKKFAYISKSILDSIDKNAKAVKFDISDINLLNFLKQIISIFIACNDVLFSNTYIELKEFVKNENLRILPDRYRFYMYLNKEGNNRNGQIHFCNFHGIVCDFAYRPFGFVMSIDNTNRIDELTEITDFTNFNSANETKPLLITLNIYPTYYPFPLDFRDK